MAHCDLKYLSLVAEEGGVGGGGLGHVVEAEGAVALVDDGKTRVKWAHDLSWLMYRQQL